MARFCELQDCPNRSDALYRLTYRKRDHKSAPHRRLILWLCSSCYEYLNSNPKLVRIELLRDL